MNTRAENHCHKNTGQSARQLQLAHERRKNKPQRHHADDGFIEYFNHRQKSEQQKPDSGKRSQQSRSGNDALNPSAEKRSEYFNGADHEESGHTDVPGELRIMCGDISRAHDSVSNADG